VCVSLSGHPGTLSDCLSVSLSQDILRLLTLWFNHGAAAEVERALEEGFQHVSIDTWLVVIPQIIARIHSPSAPVRNLIHSLLIRIGRHHPQVKSSQAWCLAARCSRVRRASSHRAIFRFSLSPLTGTGGGSQALLYPLLVACKSQSAARRAAAMRVVDHLRQHSPVLVEQAQLVSQELIRVAILWHEMWHEALEEASRMYFGEQNVEGMLNVPSQTHPLGAPKTPSASSKFFLGGMAAAQVLAPLHAIMERQGAETLQEISFVQAYGRELSEAHDWCNKYRRSRREAELNQVWGLLVYHRSCLRWFHMNSNWR
jgi:FKBP12-rapamycin complex-associated protein